MKNMAKKKLTIVHTTLATVSMITTEINTMYPNCFRIVNFMDDSMLNDIKEAGNITKEVIERFVQYVIIAKQNKSDAILLACSSIGQAGDLARKILDIPLYKIDEPMACEAVKGRKILVLGTVPSTLKPTGDLIRSKLISNDQCINIHLIPEIFQYAATDKDRHDAAIAEVVDANADAYDTIVLAQASMSGAVRFVKQTKARVLTSIPTGLNQLHELIGGED